MRIQDQIPSPQQLAARLSQVEHFRHLSMSEVRDVVDAGTIRSYPKNNVIFVENEPGTGLYVLLAGQVQLIKLSVEGQIAILAVFEPVIMFNEVAALDGGPAPATAMTLTDTVVWHLPPTNLERLLLAHPSIGLGLIRIMAAHNRRLVSHFEDLSFRSVLSRTAKLLLELSEQGKTIIDRRKHPNHQMAARIATIPEAFSRSLKIFKTNGDIETNYHEIRIMDAQHLALIAQLGPADKTPDGNPPNPA